ncbi:MAG: bifunctional metallophosphatase/5'-nucleotidase [Allorhizobium sp.]
MSKVNALTIFQINDTHGYLEAHPELVWTGSDASYPRLGGYARIASLFKQARLSNPDGVLALDNGDTMHGTYPAMVSKGEALVPLLNALKLDAMTAHWEFAWGPDHFRELVTRLNHPMLAINCYDQITGARPFHASTVVERAGLRIGIIGIAASIIDKSMPPHFSEGLHFTLGLEELPAEIKRLRQTEAADLIIVLSHLGFPQDAKLASVVSGIDVIVSGHTHNRLKRPLQLGRTTIIQSGCHGAFVGRLDLRIVEGGIVDMGHELITLDASIAPDDAMTGLVDEVMRPYRTMLNEVVGRTSIGLHRDTVLSAPMDDVLLAAVALAGGTRIAFSNGWRYGAPIPPGPVTVNDLWNIIPPNPPISTVDLTGSEIWELMEDNVQRTFASDPFEQMGGYLKRFRGMTIYGKLENPPGERIEHIFVGHDPIDLAKIYGVSFVTSQGVPQKFGANRLDLPIKAIDALKTYFQAGKDIDSETLGRFVAV